RDAMPRVMENEGGAFWQLEGETISPSGRRAPELVTVSDRGMRPSDPVARLQDMEEDGVQAQVIYGPVHPFRSADLEARAAAMRAYNDWIIEFGAVAPDRLITLAQLPSWDPALASAELERVAGRGLRGAQSWAAVTPQEGAELAGTRPTTGSAKGKSQIASVG